VNPSSQSGEVLEPLYVYAQQMLVINLFVSLFGSESPTHPIGSVGWKGELQVDGINLVPFAIL
jgi:hypothetical protein